MNKFSMSILGIFKVTFNSKGQVLLVAVLGMALNGCTTLSYYHQAISGHIELIQRRVPIAQLIAAPDTSLELKRKLKLVAAARDFATLELKLPDNDSYRSYSDLGKSYVVWNVFAAPELSIDPITSCFLFVGCLSYRGYFDEAQARRFAASLSAAGNDVFVAGVAAYSTLGWFDDPVLNTMLVWDDVRIVVVIFHELAHQLLYVDGDTVFNESFASAVAQIGIQRWLNANDQSTVEQHSEMERQQQFYDLLLKYRKKLGQLYVGAEANDIKRAKKIQMFSELSLAYQTLKKNWGGYDGYDNWMGEDLNNAKLTSISTYHNYVPALRLVLDRVNNDLNRFYAIAKILKSWSNEDRENCLSAPNGKLECLDGIINRH